MCSIVFCKRETAYETLRSSWVLRCVLETIIGFSIWMLGLNPVAILQGVICWGVAIGINQTYKQLKEENK
ncbi:phage holin family protein [Clostridioides difficile]|uniref:phage holin family protein n=1 Tax=Clostridioides difficile TaxID=1496 RepID=UPI000BCC1F52|nr:hypothetical protein BGU93_18345 [Clostridioides difficile]